MWKIDECGSWLKSVETLGASVKPKMPLSCCSAARLIAVLISSLEVARLATNLKSITDTFGVGTRIAVPSSRPASSGSTSPTALAAPVEVLMHLIERRLVIGVGMHRRHKAFVDADRVVQDLDHGSEAIGGARAVGDDGVRLVELVVVDAVDDRKVGAVGWRRDQYALGPGGEMRGRFVLGGENAGAFQRDIDAELLPRQLCRVPDGGHLDGAVAAIDAVTLDRDLAGKAAVDRIVAQQMRVGFHRREIVDRQNLEILAPGLNGGPQNVAADAAKAVDGYAYGHLLLLPSRAVARSFALNISIFAKSI